MLIDIDTAVGEARALHANNKGYFAIFRKLAGTGRTHQTSYRMSELDTVAALARNTPDVYISQSSFVNKGRRKTDLGQLGAAFVDVDCYNMGIVPTEQFALDLVDKATCYGLPVPSYIIFSGRGLYLKWLFTEPVSATNLFRWDALQLVLVSLYQAIGADMAARDASRVLRVVGSTNSTAGGAGVGLAWQGGRRYGFEELSAAAAAVDLPELKINSAVQVKKHQARVKKLQLTGPETELEMDRQGRAVIAHLNNFSAQRQPIMMSPLSLQQLNWQRFIDLRDLSILRGGVKRGGRDLTLFWMSTFLGHCGLITPENFESEIRDLASGFPGTDFAPIEDDSMCSLFDRLQAHQRGEKVSFNGQNFGALYTPTNECLINIFEITPQEQASLGTIIDTKEKRNRSDLKAPGRSERRESRVQWRQQATSLAKEAVDAGRAPNITQIAAQVCVHKTQVSRLLAKKIGQPRKVRATTRRRNDPTRADSNTYITVPGIRAARAAAGRPVEKSEADRDSSTWSSSYCSGAFVWPRNPYINRGEIRCEISEMPPQGRPPEPPVISQSSVPDVYIIGKNQGPVFQNKISTSIFNSDSFLNSSVAVFSLTRGEESGGEGAQKEGLKRGSAMIWPTSNHQIQLEDHKKLEPTARSTQPEAMRCQFVWPTRLPRRSDNSAGPLVTIQTPQGPRGTPIAPIPPDCLPSSAKPDFMDLGLDLGSDLPPNPISALDLLDPAQRKEEMRRLLQESVDQDRQFRDEFSAKRASEAQLRETERQARVWELVAKVERIREGKARRGEAVMPKS